MNAERVYEEIQKLSDERLKLDRLLGVVPEMSLEEQAALDADDLIANLRARGA